MVVKSREIETPNLLNGTPVVESLPLFVADLTLELYGAANPGTADGTFPRAKHYIK